MSLMSIDLIHQTKSDFNYRGQAELFSVRNWKSCGGRVRYRRFEAAAEVVRFAIEELGPANLVGVHLEADEQRFDGAGIRLLYDSADYPLIRRHGAVA